MKDIIIYIHCQLSHNVYKQKITCIVGGLLKCLHGFTSEMINMIVSINRQPKWGVTRGIAIKSNYK